MKGVRWFTNLDVPRQHEKLTLWENYTPEKYPTYDNYDAINVDKVARIPLDYYGIMGVPITFLDNYNPEQFEVVGASVYDDTPCRIERHYTELGYKFYKSNGTPSASGALRDRTSPKVRSKGKNDYSIGPNGEVLSATYVRIFIKRK